MIEYKEFLKENPSGVLSTNNGDKLDSRILHSLFTEGNKLYFCTSSDKPIYAQLVANPNASFCAYPSNYSPVVTLNGKVVFVEDILFKTQVMEEIPMVKRNYQTPENPVFKLFYLGIEEVKTYFPGKGTTREECDFYER